MGLIALCVAALLALLLLLLAVPIRVRFRLDRVERVEGQVRIDWLFGLVRWVIGIPTATKAKSARKRPRKTAQRRKARKPRNSLAPLRQSPFRRRVIRLAKDVLRATHARDVYLRLRIGLGDPADTGRLWAILGPIAGIAANVRKADLRLEPEFMDPVLELESHGEFRLIPLQFVYLASAFLLSPATLRALRTSSRSNR